MNQPTSPTTSPLELDANAGLRRAVYALLIAVSAGAMIGRILSVNAVDRAGMERVLVQREVAARERALREAGEPVDREQLQREATARLAQQRPFLSANDRSRWAMIRALVEQGTYAIDDIVSQPNWDTIDMVQHKDRHGVPRLYSSKPPLLGTLYAGPYWLIHRATGATLGTHPYEIGRTLLVLFNVVPLMIAWWVLGTIVERYGRTDWGRIFTIAAAVFGTFLTTFAVTLNNHLPAAVSVTIVLWAVLRICCEDDRRGWVFALAGFFAAFAVACELPALALFALVSAWLGWKAPRPTLAAYLPAAAIVAIAYFGTNWIAHDSLRPPYAHRKDGPVLFQSSADAAAALDAAQLPGTLAEQFAEAGRPLSIELRVDVIEPGKRWIVRDLATVDSYPINARDGQLEVRLSDNWYDYEWVRKSDGRVIPSYWRNPGGIDKGEPSAARYALHVLIGHHGIFSLTPVWLLAIPGVVLLWRSDQRRLREVALLIAVVSVACIAFYLSRPQGDRNYGGMTSAFRWVFWMAPLWLLAVLPTADRLTCCRWGRGLGCVLLAASVLSAAYPTWNPWTLPWLTNFWLYMGWARL